MSQTTIRLKVVDFMTNREAINFLVINLSFRKGIY